MTLSKYADGLSAAIKKIIPISLTKFICMALSLFLLIFVHTTLYLTKNSMVLSFLSAEMISTMKFWLITPTSLLFMLIYMKLSDVFSREKLFYISLWFCLSYCLLFALVLFPNRDVLTLNMDHLILAIPSLKYVLMMVSFWHFSLFYLAAELLVGIVFVVSFWNIMNSITNVKDAKTIYPILAIVGQGGAMVASGASAIIAKTSNDWQHTLNILSASIFVAGVLLTICIYAVNRLSHKDVSFDNADEKASSVKKKDDSTFMEKLKYIMTSKYIVLATVLLLCYNIAYNLCDALNKKSVELYFAGRINDMYSFLSQTMLYMAIVTVGLSLMITYLLPRIKWRSSALITPIILLVTGTAFCGFFMIYRNYPTAMLVGFPIAGMSMFFGTIHFILLKATKHSVIDPVKELVFIPLNFELKAKGKTFAEIIGARVGRGFGSFLQQALLMVFVGFNLVDLAPILFAIFFIVMVCWFVVTFKLGKLIDKPT
jgi:ATP:ADP antiporter, AAA family